MQKYAFSMNDKGSAVFATDVGGFYLAADVDALLADNEKADDIWHEQTRQQTEALNARIAELEKALRSIQNNVMCPQFFRQIASTALMER